MTYQDIHSIKAFHEKIVIAVKVPAELRLDISVAREHSITVCIRSTNGSIAVYLCEVDPDYSSNKVCEGIGTSSSKKKKTHPEYPDRKYWPWQVFLSA